MKKVRNWLIGALVVIGALGLSPAGAAVAASASPAGVVVEAQPDAARHDPVASMVPAISFWAGAGVLGLGAGMVTVLTIGRRQRADVQAAQAAT